MDFTAKHPRPPRSTVLIISHGDGHLEIFGDGIDVHLARVPYIGTPAGERLAEDWIEATIPRRFRPIYFPGLRRATGTTVPLLPSTIKAANEAKQAIASLNELDDAFLPPAESEVVQWT